MKIAVLGAGSWGSALAMQLTRQNHHVHLWDIDSDHINTLLAHNENRRHLPGNPFNAAYMHPYADLSVAVTGVDFILLVPPSHAFRDLLQMLVPLLADNQNIRLCWATKGFDPESKQLLHTVVEEIFPSAQTAVLSGPSFAKEVAQNIPTAVTLASANDDFAKTVSHAFSSANFRVQRSSDIIGVQIGGAAKNPLAIATGMADGLGLGRNTQAALITQGLLELESLAKLFGGRSETLSGLAGIGDLVLTCSDNQSRNRRFGLALGQGHAPEAAKTEIGQVVEGEQNAFLIQAIIKEHSTSLPIISSVARILQNEIDCKAGFTELFAKLFSDA